MNYYNDMIMERERLQNELLRIEELDFPSGTLECYKRGTRYCWIHAHNDTRSYIGKKEIELAADLAFKAYMKRVYREDQVALQATNAYIRAYDQMPARASAQLLNHPAYRDLLLRKVSRVSREAEVWMKADYVKNPLFPENKTIRAVTGEMVRSKSEACILGILHEHHIPFRYESVMYLDNDWPVYPDFTIRHPHTGELFLWEHLGLVDDANYAQAASSKIFRYMQNGWCPMQNLILTSESKKQPLDLQRVRRLVRTFFLA